MATQSKLPQSLFPDYPREPKIVNDKGELDSSWSLGLSALFQALQKNYKNEGIQFPQLDITSINNIAAIYAPYIGVPLPTNIPDISGQTIFDTTNRIPKQFIITYDTATPPNVTSAQWLILNVMLLHGLSYQLSIVLELFQCPFVGA